MGVHEEERLRKRRQMEAETKAHERELQKAAHEAKQLELLQERQTQLEHLASMQKTPSLSSEQLAAYLLASEQGPPAKLSRSSARTASARAAIAAARLASSYRKLLETSVLVSGARRSPQPLQGT